MLLPAKNSRTQDYGIGLRCPIFNIGPRPAVQALLQLPRLDDRLLHLILLILGNAPLLNHAAILILVLLQPGLLETPKVQQTAGGEQVRIIPGQPHRANSTLRLVPIVSR